MSEHVPTGCDQCGQTDDHPKLHYGVETFHHDCTPVRVRNDVASHPLVPQIIAAAESGLRGEQLRQHIYQLHAEPAAPAEQPPADTVPAPAPAPVQEG